MAGEAVKVWREKDETDVWLLRDDQSAL